jgi:hypothetical protein
MTGFDGFRFVHADMFKFDYSQEFDVYINTSTEHIPSVSDWAKRIPANKIVCIQSNNYFACDQHINCVSSLLELEKQLFKSGNVKEILYQGVLKLPIYDRYMMIATT